jgi:glycosyltransferase involved in cell wall biosynthesis
MSREISPKDAVTIWKLYKLLRRERPDLVHTHTAKAGTAGRLAGIAYKWLTPGTLIGRPRACRFVHTYHGHVFHSYYGKLKTRLFLAIERALARLATDRIIVISPQQLREINKDFKVGRPHQFAVVPLGLDTSLFADRASRRPAARTAVVAGEDEVLVGIVGRLTEIKNHRLFIEMVQQFRELDPETAQRVRFLVIGDGHLRNELESYAKGLGVEREVEFLGMRDDPENFYAALDIVALTSLNEGTPLTLIEAMANGCACVATRVGGVPDLLGELKASMDDGFQLHERGISARSGDATGLARGLAYLISNDSKRAELGRRGREFIESTYSKQRLIGDIEQLYLQLCGRKSTVTMAQNVTTGGAESKA